GCGVGDGVRPARHPSQSASGKSSRPCPASGSVHQSCARDVNGWANRMTKKRAATPNGANERQSGFEGRVVAVMRVNLLEPRARARGQNKFGGRWGRRIRADGLVRQDIDPYQAPFRKTITGTVWSMILQSSAKD